MSNYNNALIITINGKEYQPLRKIVSKEEILELADLENGNLVIYLLDEHGKKIEIDSHEGIELQSGMRFIISST